MRIVRPLGVREFLREHGVRQVSEDAVVDLSAALEGLAERFLSESLSVFHGHNQARILQRLEPLHRLTGEHVRKALGRQDANR